MASRPDSLAKWYERIVLESTGYYRRAFTDPWTGERHRASLKTKDRDEAARAVRDWFEIAEQKARKTAYVAAGLITKEEAAARQAITLHAACTRYMGEHGGKLPSADHMRAQHKVLGELLGDDTLLSAIGEPEIHGAIKTLEKETVIHRDGDRLMAESTINGYVRRLATLMRYARKKWHADCAPGDIDWSGLYLDEPDFERTIIETDDEEDRLRAALPEDFARVYDFALLIGKRRTEVITLQKAQVKWLDGVVGRAGGAITFRIKSRTRDRRQGGQSGKVQSVPMTAGMAAVLAAAWRQSDSPYVFTYVCGKGRTWIDAAGERRAQRTGERYPMSPTALKDAWTAARAATGMLKLRWHDLRSTKITRLLDEGNSLPEVAEIIGHSDIATTMKYVKKGRVSRQRDALERSEQLAAARRASRVRQTGTGTALKVVK